MSLKDTVAKYVADPDISALVVEADLEPVSGPSSAVAPPTYASSSKDNSSSSKDNSSGPNHAYSPESFVPKKDPTSGWYSQIQVNDDTGTPRIAGQVKLDAVASQSGRAETPLWQEQKTLGIDLPGIVVDGESGQSKDQSPDERAAFDFELSTWNAAHRQVDAWFKFATQDGKTQIWQQPIVDPDEADPDKDLKTIISSASRERAELLYRFFPNAAIYGFWLSSGTAQRHKLPRAYSSEITGYGAHPITTGTTKLDATGGTSKSTKVDVGKDYSLKLSPKGKTPSQIGFGQIPKATSTRSYQCELILQQANISLPILRSLRFRDAEQAAAAQVVLTLLSMAGHVLSSHDLFLRSECSLVSIEERWGWRRRGNRTPEALETPTFDEVAEALRQAVEDAEAVGLSFAEPISVRLSDAERQLIAARAEEQRTKISSEES